MEYQLYVLLKDLIDKELKMRKVIGCNYDSKPYNISLNEWQGKRENMLQEFHELVSYCYDYYMMELTTTLEIEEEVFQNCKLLLFKMIEQHKDSDLLKTSYYSWEEVYVKFYKFTQKHNYSQKFLCEMYSFINT